MPGLLLILTEAVGERFSAAVELAAAAAALDRPVAVLLRGPAVSATGRPEVAKVYDLLFEMGASVSLCQTAMVAHGLTPRDLSGGIEAVTMAGFLAGREDWQLVLA